MEAATHMNNPQTPDAGYSIDLGNAASRNAYDWAKKTFANRAGLPGEPAQDLDGGFSNEIRFGQERLGISSDGIGTKIEVAERLNKYDTLGYDLVAMTADDLIAAGFVPTNLSNIIDVNYARLRRGGRADARPARRLPTSRKLPSPAAKSPSWATASAAGRARK
ncbi:MAG: AIR synthase related protein [Hymenobacter sp.]